ncbi:MAG: hypothetical protein MUF09_10660, partial [Candidatus Nanopelagicales bacterium]|nr:hypothetical protein [Candidatus Nanopelagicales bacterium]
AAGGDEGPGASDGPPQPAGAGRGRQAPLLVALSAAVLLTFAARPLAQLLTSAAAVLAGAR